MRIDLGYVLGHLSEFVLFLYFANTSFLPKKNYLNSSIAAFIGYIILFGLGVFGYVYISCTAFIVVNLLLLIKEYNVKIFDAVFYSIILALLSNIGEYIVAFGVGTDFSVIPISFTPQQSFAITLGGKLFYFTGIVILKHFANKHREHGKYSLVIAFVPLITIVCLFMTMRFEVNFYLFYMLCISLMFINIIAFLANELINEQKIKLELLQMEYIKNKNVLAEYKLLSEKYENTRIMRHDFNKQLKVLKELIDTDNKSAHKYMRQLEQTQRELNYAQYTDNKILNILLSQKIKESGEHGVEIHIQSTAPSFKCVSEMDTVAIFSNLLDNAIEAAEQSAEKVIFIDLYTINKTYSVAKVENSADTEPIILNGIFQTQKLKYELHGIGIKSINNALKQYGSKLRCEYDKEKKFFRSIVLIHTEK